MNEVLKFMQDPYGNYLRLLERGYPEFNDWPLIRSPIPTLTLCGLYVYCAKIVGPRFMKQREPLNLKGWIILYNLTMVIVNTYLFIKLGIHGWFGRYNWICQPMDFANPYHFKEMAKTCYIYFLFRFVDFMDTFFFVARKKFNHVNGLHVTHHAIMPFVTWLGRFSPGGQGSFACFLNSFVHMVMYSYYLLSALGPQFRKYLWWKKYITTLQMIQFVILLAHTIPVIFMNCDFPKFYAYMLVSINTLFFLLFLNFFRRSYSKKVK